MFKPKEAYASCVKFICENCHVPGVSKRFTGLFSDLNIPNMYCSSYHSPITMMFKSPEIHVESEGEG